MNEITVAITGAAGQIAYQLIPMVLGGHVFGNAKIHLKLVDIPDAVPKLAGVVMEMEDCAWSHMRSIEAFSSDALDQGFKDIDFAFFFFGRFQISRIPDSRISRPGLGRAWAGPGPGLGRAWAVGRAGPGQCHLAHSCGA